MPHFTGDINIETLIAFSALMWTFYRFHISNVQRFTKLETRVGLIYRNIKVHFGSTVEDDEEEE